MDYPIYDMETIREWPYTSLNFTSYAPPTPEFFHKHTFWEFAFILSGSANNYLPNGTKILMQAGDAYLLHPEDAHCLRTKGNFHRHRDVYVSPEKMKRICDALSPTLYEELLNRKGPIFFKLNNLSLQTLQNQLNVFSAKGTQTSSFLDAYHASIVSFLLGEIVKESLLPTQSPPEWLSTFIVQLHDVGYMSMRIEQICALTKYSQGYLSRIFKKYFGVTLEQFVINLRMEYATQLLDNSDLSILQIANKLGYDTPNNFTNNFKKKYGVPPNKWRKNKSFQS